MCIRDSARSNNFLALFYLVKEAWILVFSDVSTGEVIWDRVPQDNISQIYDSLSMYRPVSYTHLDVYKRQLTSYRSMGSHKSFRIYK